MHDLAIDEEFGRGIALHREAMTRVARQWACPCPQFDEDDIVQVASVRMLTAYREKRLDLMQEGFRTYCLTRVEWVAKEHLKRCRARGGGPDSGGSSDIEDTAPGADPVESASWSELLEQLEVCLSKLPLRLREAVEGRFVNGLSFAEIANKSEIGDTGAAHRVIRALQLLHECIVRRDAEA